VCRREVETSELLVLLLGDRYGDRPPGESRSYTELEYRWAIERGIPVLAFVADETLSRPLPPRDALELDDYLADLRALALFVYAVMADHTVKVFSGPDPGTFRLDLYQSLEPYRPKPPRHPPGKAAAAVGRLPVVRRSLPSPPTLCAMPSSYVGSAPFTGRGAQLRLLDKWARSHSSVMVVEAIGGTGKSALTWEWTTASAESVVDDLAGRFWWSFYDGSASMVRFLRELVGYLTETSSSIVSELSTDELPILALNELRKRPYLVVLDGFERLLLAYHQYDPSKVTDENVEEDRRLNKHSMIDSYGYDFVRSLTRPMPSRVLINTRMTPDALQGASGALLPGVVEMRLPGLTNVDVVSVLRQLGVTAHGTDVANFFEPLHNHPLLIAIVAGMVRDYRDSPGNFAAWVHGSGFRLGTVKLTERRQHVLAASLEGLDPPASRLLSRLSVLSGSVRWDIVRAVNPHRLDPTTPNSLAEGMLDASLRDLEARGLLWWNRELNTYDMHPIVRAYAHESLDSRERINANERIRDHFRASPPAVVTEASSVEDLEEAIMVFRALTGAQHPGEAESVWERQLAEPLLIRLGANASVIELLQPHRANYATTLPADLSIALHLAGRHDEGETVEVGVLRYLLSPPGPDVREVCVSLCRLTTHLRSMGRFAECAKATGLLADLVRGQLGSPADAVPDLMLRQTIATILAGDYRTAADSLERLASIQPPAENPWFRGDLRYWGLALSLWSGRPVSAEALSDAEREFPSWRSRLRLRSLLFEHLSATGNHAAALTVAADIDRIRRVGGQDVVPAESALSLAALGRSREAMEALDECVARMPRLHYFDRPYYSLARALGYLGRDYDARRYAALAYKQAWADGPPFSHAPNLRKAADVLSQLGVKPPVLPSRTADQVLVPLEPELRAVCANHGESAASPRVITRDTSLFDRLMRKSR
jgi:tetratricopeptide (TPR) repeat protein